MKRLLGAAFAAAVALAPPTTASAQRPGAIEIGAFGAGTWFDDVYGVKDRWGVGGRLGCLRVFALRGHEHGRVGGPARMNVCRVHDVVAVGGEGVARLAPGRRVIGAGLGGRQLDECVATAVERVAARVFEELL